VAASLRTAGLLTLLEPRWDVKELRRLCVFLHGQRKGERDPGASRTLLLRFARWLDKWFLEAIIRFYFFVERRWRGGEGRGGWVQHADLQHATTTSKANMQEGGGSECQAMGCPLLPSMLRAAKRLKKEKGERRG